MTWWNPKSWSEKSANKQEPALKPVPEFVGGPFVWVEVNPERAHMGLDFYSDTSGNPFKYAIRVGGLTRERARVDLVGKVLDWNRFTPEQISAIESGNPPFIPYETLKAMYL